MKLLVKNFLLIPFLYSCGNLSQLQDVSEVRSYDRERQLAKFNQEEPDFELLTSVGKEIYLASQNWKTEQINWPNYPKPAMCANNVGIVLNDALKTKKYNDPLVPEMVNKIRAHGGLVVELPKDKQGIINTINKYFPRGIPTGALVSGCLRKDCTGTSGSGHIAILGERKNGDLYLDHNNWYRPATAQNHDPASTWNGEGWENFMVSPEFLKRGFPRQWMSTPWLRLSVAADGYTVVDIKSLLPALDDLDPMQFFVTISIIPEINDQM